MIRPTSPDEWRELLAAFVAGIRLGLMVRTGEWSDTGPKIALVGSAKPTPEWEALIDELMATASLQELEAEYRGGQ